MNLVLFVVALLAVPSFCLAANNSNPGVIKLNSEEDVAITLAIYITNLSKKYINDKGSFSVVLSGSTLISTMR